MSALKVMIFFFSLLLPGYLILALFFDQASRGFLKKLALSFALGMLWLSWQLLVLLFVWQLKIGAYFIWLLMAENLLLLIFYGRRYGFDFKKRWNFTLKNFKPLEILFSVLITTQLLFAAANAAVKPVATFDSLAMWALKAKTIFLNQGVVFDSGQPGYWAAASHHNYPPLVPLAQFWQSFLVGRFDEILINWIFVAFYAALLFFLYGSLRAYLNRTYSLFFTWLLATMPLILYHSYSVYADLPLAFFLTVAFVYWYKWLEAGGADKLVLAALFMAGAALTKNDAVFFILAGVLATMPAVAFNWRKWRQWLLGYGLVLTATLAPWWWFMWRHDLGLSNVTGGWGWHPQIFKSFYTVLFIAASWNIWWFVFVLLTALFSAQIVKQRPLALAYLNWLAAAGGLLLLYLLTESYQYAVDGTAVSRTLIGLAPLSLWLIAMLARREFFAANKFFQNKND